MECGFCVTGLCSPKEDKVDDFRFIKKINKEDGDQIFGFSVLVAGGDKELATRAAVDLIHRSNFWIDGKVAVMNWKFHFSEAHISLVRRDNV